VRIAAELAAVLWSVLSPSSTIPTAHSTTYVPRAANILRLIFHDHFHTFADAYDSLYAQDYGKFRLQRISRVVDRFAICGDYTKGIVRIRSHGIPRHSVLKPRMPPRVFSSFFLQDFLPLPLLFAEYLDEQLLLMLPHRKFVFSIPKALRVFLLCRARHKRKPLKSIGGTTRRGGNHPSVSLSRFGFGHVVPNMAILYTFRLSI